MFACAICFSVGIFVQGALAPLHAADPQRYTNALTPLLDAAGGKPIGSLQPGVPLDAIGQSGNATHVALHGWSAQSANAVVLAAPSRRVLLLSGFTGQGTPGASQTVNGTVYQEVTVDGWVATSALVDDVQTVWKSAADLYAQKCSTCHALPAVSSLGVSQWPAIMETQAVNAGLDANETALLTAYLQTNTTR